MVFFSLLSSKFLTEGHFRPNVGHTSYHKSNSSVSSQSKISKPEDMSETQSSHSGYNAADSQPKTKTHNGGKKKRKKTGENQLHSGGAETQRRI